MGRVAPRWRQRQREKAGVQFSGSGDFRPFHPQKTRRKRAEKGSGTQHRVRRSEKMPICRRALFTLNSAGICGKCGSFGRKHRKFQVQTSEVSDANIGGFKMKVRRFRMASAVVFHRFRTRFPPFPAPRPMRNAAFRDRKGEGSSGKRARKGAKKGEDAYFRGVEACQNS